MSSSSSWRDRLRRTRRGVRRSVLARRRLLAALLVGIAVAAGVRAVSAPPPATVATTVAGHDLPAGTVLSPDDLRTTEQPPDAVPTGVVPEAVGQTLAAPVRAGEPITDVRLVGGNLAAAHPELTTLPVRIPDAGSVELLTPGDRIDLVATDPHGGPTRVVAGAALVLATPPPGPEAGATALPGALVVLGVDPTEATAVTAAGVRSLLSYAFAR